MSIRKQTLSIIRVYLAGISYLKNDPFCNQTGKEKLEKSEQLLNIVASTIDSAIDDYSEDAAKFQMQILNTMELWAKEYSYGVYTNQSYEELQKAVEYAQFWASLPVSRKETHGFFKFLSKKESVETTYLTYDEAMKNEFHHRMLILSKCPEAEKKVEILPSLICEFRSRINIFSSHCKQLEDAKKMLESLEQKKVDLDSKLADAATAFELSLQLQTNGDPQLASELLNINSQIQQIISKIAKLKDNIKNLEEQKKFTNEIIENLEFVYSVLYAHMCNKQKLVLLADLINIFILYRIMDNTATEQDICDYISMESIFKIAVQEMTDSHQTVFDCRREIQEASASLAQSEAINLLARLKNSHAPEVQESKGAGSN